MKTNTVAAFVTPSWVVNIVAGGFALLLTIATIVARHYQGSQLQQEIFNAKLGTTVGSGTTANYQTITTNIADNRFLADLPLLLLWASVGLVVYYLTMAIVRSLGQVVQLRDEMNTYVNVSRQSLLRESLLRLGVRVAAMLGWVAVTKLSLSVLVPYALAAASSAAFSITLISAGYVLLALIVLYVVILLQAISLRLITLRPRLFGGN